VPCGRKAKQPAAFSIAFGAIKRRFRPSRRRPADDGSRRNCASGVANRFRFTIAQTRQRREVLTKIAGNRANVGYRCLFLERPVLTYDFRLPPGPRTVEYALLAEELGFRAVWCPEIPAFGHDIWVTLARIAEKTKRIKFGPSVLIPSYRHPMAQASAIATLEQIAPGRLMVGFGTGFTGRAGMGKKPLSLASMRTHIAQVKALLRGQVAEIDGGLAQILASAIPATQKNYPSRFPLAASNLRS
jgi:hypothetical protein